MSERVWLNYQQIEASAAELVGKLELMHDRNLPDDRARLAKLRRGLGLSLNDVTASDVVQPLLWEDAPREIEQTLYLIGPLFAFHRLPYDGHRRGNMGDHFRALSAGEELNSAVERRFLSLLAAEPDELPDALRQAVALLRAKDVAVNWRQLFVDVYRWLDRSPFGEQKRQDVRLAWSRALWRLPPRQVAADESQAEEQPTP
jgi:CRISPR system Cascade subunit CasB